jgi:hypothetical protein
MRLQLEAYRRDQRLLVLVGQNYTVTGFNGGARQAIFENPNFTVSANTLAINKSA